VLVEGAGRPAMGEKIEASSQDPGGTRDGATSAALDCLEARGVTYRYPGSGRGVAAVDLRVPRGSFTVVTGRIGAGKTTLLRVVLGLLPLTEGEVLWNDQRVAERSLVFRPPRCAYVPQVPRLFSDSVRR